ncbi:MAG: pantoate--beta-alanine ligase [Gemmatimonadota bacterium]|nr:pantoate--beta-alanine ligase [Gemmatimonadota bacterium]
MTSALAAPPAVDAPAETALLRTVAEMRAWVATARSDGQRVALVPTMGALHAGHLSLVDRARERADRVVLSIFVNPLQFGAGEDLDRYPRDLQGDLESVASRGVDRVFAPSTGEMYPHGAPEVTLTPGPLGERLCGTSRPGHFAGVLTVVAKLFAICAPDVAVFGQKDFQQTCLIRRMAADLNLPVRIEVAPVVREPDGLALSSRNRYLSPAERAPALGLVRALREARRRFAAGEGGAERLRQGMFDALREAGAAPEYAEVVDAERLERLQRAGAGALCAVAARVGTVRLIDNTLLGVDDPIDRRE